MTPGKIASIGFVALALLAGCARKAPEAPVKAYEMHGVIQQLDPSSHTAIIKHDAIPGFMEAMTMEYPVRDRGQFAKLRSGEKIDATLYAQDDVFWVGNFRESK